jgi:hypothetical protein
MNETLNKNYSMDPDSFEVPRQSNSDKANRLVYRANEIKPAANLEEIQKQNNIQHNKTSDKNNSSNKFRPSPGLKSPMSKNEAVENPKDKEDKKPYYGKVLVFAIIVLIIIEYYAYIFARLEFSKGILIFTIQINRQLQLRSSQHAHTIYISHFILYDDMEPNSHNDYSSRRNTFILGMY